MTANYRAEVDNANLRIILHWGSYIELLSVMGTGKINAIKWLREATNLSLREAKDAIELLGFRVSSEGVPLHWTPQADDNRAGAHVIVDGAPLAIVTNHGPTRETTVLTFAGGTVSFDTETMQFQVSGDVCLPNLIIAAEAPRSRFKAAGRDPTQVLVNCQVRST